MKSRPFLFCLACLCFCSAGFPLRGHSEDPITRERAVRKGARITGAALGISTVTFYAVGPYTGLDFEDDPLPAVSVAAIGSLTALGSSYLSSVLFTDAVIKSEAGPLSAGAEGIFAGALAGGMTNGLAFAAMFGLGVPTGAIELNGAYEEHLDRWYKSASIGFLGGFAYGMLFGALAGAVGGPVISLSMGY